MTFLTAGFRPFFLFAPVWAAVAVPLWLATYGGADPLGLPFSALIWHGHSLVFGFGCAAVAGFLLTAVPNWTGTAPVSGPPLLALVLTWLAGRAAFVLAGWLPPGLVAAVDLAFLPMLALAVLKPIFAARNRRNYQFLPLLAVLWLAQAMVAAEVMGWWTVGMVGVRLGMFTLLAMIAVVGGRVVPAFTANALKAAGTPVEPRRTPWLERAALPVVVLTGLAYALRPDSLILGGLALLGAVIHGARLAGWHGHRTLNEPLLWVLHLGYAWLPAGLLLLGLSTVTYLVPASAGVHALTVGCIATMILAVASRAALGHSGRPLTAGRAVTLAYGLVTAAALVRSLAPIAAPGFAAAGGLHLAALLWGAGWLVFAVRYLPILLEERR